MSDPPSFNKRANDMNALHQLIAARANENVPQHCFSIDGRSFRYEARLTLNVPTGSYVKLETSEGKRYLGQIMSKEVLVREGPEYGVEADEMPHLLPEGVSKALLTNRVLLRSLHGTGILLARLEDEHLEPLHATDLFHQADMQLADSSLVSRYLAGRNQSASLDIGQALYVDGDAPVSLNAAGFNRHSFLCGQSGSGKTFSLGIILEQLLLQTQLRMIILDPNSDFVNLASMRSLEEVNRVRENALSAADYERLKTSYAELAKGIRVFRPKHLQASNDLVLRFGDLSSEEQASCLKLDPLHDREEFNTLMNVIESLEHGYTLSDVQRSLSKNFTAEARQLSLRIANLKLTDWDIWCDAKQQSLVDKLEQGDWRCLVLDIGSLGTSQEKTILANAVLGHLWRMRNKRDPVLLVIDEAHNVCPEEPGNELEAIASDHVVRIAGEGRKFGLYLLVASQRPSKIHHNVLSQCDNLALMRMNSVADLNYLSNLLSQVPESLIQQALHFKQGESLLSGRIVQNPSLVRFGGRLSVEGGSDIPTEWATKAP